MPSPKRWKRSLLRVGRRVHSLRFDLRFALRTMRRAPLVYGLAVLCIGLGIGAVTTIYSFATAFTFRPAPIP